jgi:hypothetical protein
MWECPECGRYFVNRNQEHSCGSHSVKKFLLGRGPRAVELFMRFWELVESCGPVIVAPAKTRVGFQVRMIFAAVNRLSDKSLTAHVILSRRLEHPRFKKIDTLSPTTHVHHFQVNNVQELDDEVRGWLRESYKVGVQKPFTARGAPPDGV